MQIEPITEVAALIPGVTLIEVEAYGDGSVFQVNAPLVIVKEPPSKGAQWQPGSRWFVWARKVEDEDESKNVFILSIPSADGVTITRPHADHSTFFVYTPELEQKLRELKSLEEYRAFTGV